MIPSPSSHIARPAAGRDRWTLAGRVIRALLRVPTPVLDRLIDAPPIELEGRVLDRRVQAVLARFRADAEAQLRDTAKMRREHDRLSRLAIPSRDGLVVADRSVSTPAGRVPVRTYRRLGTTTAEPGIVFLHGGGWCKGGLDASDGTCRILADVTGCVVVSVAYRLAPEDPFPAAVDDALAAWGWVHDHADEIGIEPGRVSVMGESAGANLAAVVAQQARRRALPEPVAQGLLYPALDMRLQAPSVSTFAEGFGLDLASMEAYRRAYAPDPATWASPLVSPLLADDLTGLAPALVVTAGFDPLHDDGRLYATRLSDAGVPVRYRCYDAHVHAASSVCLLPGGVAMAEEVAASMGALARASDAAAGVRTADR